VDEQTTTQDEPVAPQEPTQPVEQAGEPTTQDVPDTTETPETTTTKTTDVEQGATVDETEEDEDFEYPNPVLPEFQPIDFSQLPVGEDNLIDPNALAGTINQSIAAAEERATLRAQQAYAEQRAEEKAWQKAYEKYPELKNNKELRDLVHNARLGRVADMLSKTQDASSVKLPTPSQIADSLFKHIGNAKVEGMKQATENTKVQSSAYVETATKSTNDAADARTKAFQNINNPNKEIAKKARAYLLKSMVFGDE
jgi:hypothetical protein